MLLDAKSVIKGSITVVACGIAVGHAIWPAVRIEAITFGLLVLAIFPWLASVVKSIEVPGVGKIELREVQQQVQEVRAELEPIRDKLTEPQMGQETDTERPSASAKVLSPDAFLRGVNEDERKVLKAFNKKPFAYRTRTGLAQDAELAKTEVNRIVEDLKRRGFVGSKTITTKTGEQKKRWYITEKGLQAILED